MNSASVIQNFKPLPAMLACLACAVLLSAAQAAELAQPADDDVSLVTVTDHFREDPTLSLPAAPEPPSADSPQCDTPISCEAMAGGSESWPQPLVRAPAVACQPESRSDPWQWVPLGMIPYIGPRTPDCYKDFGIFEPLPRGKSWRSRPFSISTFVGATNGGELISGHVKQRPSVYAGFNFGWDYDHYWGIEKRLGFGALNLVNGADQSIPKTGMSVTGEYRLMYYPLGDTRWRPFFTGGVGWSDFYFNDDRGASHLDTVGMVPFGVGVKYRGTERLAVRMDLIDELTFGNGPLATFQYVALTAGLEVRLGKRLLHMPWSRH